MKVRLYNAESELFCDVEVGDWSGAFLDLCYTFIGCSCVTVVDLPDGVSVWVDDNGLLRENVLSRVGGYPEPLAGHVVFTGGVDDEGNTLDMPDVDVKVSKLGKLVRKL